MMHLQAPQAKGSLAYVSTGGNAVGARSAEGAAFVSMDGNAISARSAEEAAFVSTDEYAVGARSAAEAVFVSMGGYAVSARSAEEVVFVSTDEYAVGASIVLLIWAYCREVILVPTNTELAYRIYPALEKESTLFLTKGSST